MSVSFSERLRAAFAPPRYMSFPLAGIDISSSSVKAVRLNDELHGLTIAAYADIRLPPGAFVNGEILDHDVVADAVSSAAKKTGISSAAVSLPESKSFLFETVIPRGSEESSRIAIEQRLEELIPIPPTEAIFDFLTIEGTGCTPSAVAGTQRIVGIGFARRVIDSLLSLFDKTNIHVRALEEETFAIGRALLPQGDDTTSLIIDVGKTTTKVAVVTGRVPRFATTIGIGGHALTLAVQKHFGVTEAEARTIKVDRGIVPAPGNEDYLAAMMSTVSAIRDEIVSRLNYWQERAAVQSEHSPVTQVLLVGGNSSVRGLPEYLEGSLNIPVNTGDVFTNLASHDTWIPSVDYAESLAYATSVGLALYDNA